MNSYISAIGTATPEYCYEQSEIASFMLDNLPMSEEEQMKLKLIYRASGIGQRYSTLQDFGSKSGDFTFFGNDDSLQPFPDIALRMRHFKHYALPLSLKAAKACFEKTPHIQPKDITHIVTVCCTGMYAPGLDIELVNALELPGETQRTAINFMGCYAAFNALKMADHICQSKPDAKVLIVAVELCTLHFQRTIDDDNILANALFADGAAAVICEGQKQDSLQLEMRGFHSALAPAGADEMAWQIGNYGFEMRLSQYVPDFIEKGIKTLAGTLLNKFGKGLKDIAHFAIHPGGKKILTVIEQQLDILPEQNHAAYHVLKNFGNMSSPTVLFVLNQLMKDFTQTNKDDSILSFAFGPGLTLESLLLKVSN